MSHLKDDEASILDVLIVGTGFSGTYLLHRLLSLNRTVLAIDSGTELGGVWNSNTYPGCGVDIEVPSYALDIEDVWGPKDGEDGWRWSVRFPGREELQEYFRFVDRRLGGLSKHCVFGTWVESAVWDDGAGVWEIKARDGRSWKARNFIPALGYAAKPYVPEMEGLEVFKGVRLHTAEWPREGIELEGKRVGVVGTGASGVQFIQTVAPKVKDLTVFQKRPATAIPMRQRELGPADLDKSREEWREFFGNRKNYFDGAKGAMILRTAKGDTPEQREEEFERLWQDGGFSFWTSNYMDLFGDEESNDIIYDWWMQQVRKRVKDPKKQEILAPTKPVYGFGLKRVPLESTYYDVFNLNHVHLVNLGEDPIVRITPEGPQTQSGDIHEVDVLVFATGFDFATGSMTQIDIRGKGGLSLKDKWKNGTKTYMGMAIEGFPNMLFPYGPQSPSNTCNGPLCAELQGEWIINALEHLRSQGKTRIEAESHAEEEWTAHATGLLTGSLFDRTKSYYFGDNIPGKKRELLFYFGGVPGYMEKCNEVAREGYRGFKLS